MSDSNSLPAMPDPSALPQVDKIRLAKSLKGKGYSIDEIAAHLKCCPKTIYNYLNKARQERLAELEACKSIDVLVENLETIENLQDLCLKLACQISNEKQIDPLTGKIVKKNGSPRDKAELLRLVRDFLKMKIDLELRTGVMPSTADRIYDILADKAKSADAKEEAASTRPELEQMVIDRLTKQTFL